MADHLYLCNHDLKVCFNLGKIRTGGAIEHRLLSFSRITEMTKQIGSDYRDEILVRSIGIPIELLTTNDERLDDLQGMKYRIMYFDEVLSGEE